MPSPGPRSGPGARSTRPSRTLTSCPIARNASSWSPWPRRWSGGMPEGRAGPVIFAAGTLTPISSPPLRDGAVLVRGGRIEAVGDLADIGRKNPDVEVRFFPDYTMIPGAVNAHAHLGFRRKDAPEGTAFSEWLGELIERLPEKEAWTAEGGRRVYSREGTRASRRSARACRRAGQRTFPLHRGPRVLAAGCA